MQTIIKVLISAIVGFVVAWLCYQVFHLEQGAATFVSILATSAAWAVCDKASKRN